MFNITAPYGRARVVATLTTQIQLHTHCLGGPSLQLRSQPRPPWPFGNLIEAGIGRLSAEIETKIARERDRRVSLMRAVAVHDDDADRVIIARN